MMKQAKTFLLPLLFAAIFTGCWTDAYAQAGKNEFGIFNIAITAFQKEKKDNCVLTFVSGGGEKKEALVNFDDVYVEFLKWLGEFADEGWKVEQFTSQLPTASNAWIRYSILLHRVNK